MLTQEQMDQEANKRGFTAPRVTTETINKMVVNEQYYVFPGTTVTTCCLTLVNGFTVVGHSACASPNNFDEEYGRQIASERAWDQIRRLEGYRLSSKLHEEGKR